MIYMVKCINNKDDFFQENEKRLEVGKCYEDITDLYCPPNTIKILLDNKDIMLCWEDNFVLDRIID